MERGRVRLRRTARRTVSRKRGATGQPRLAAPRRSAGADPRRPRCASCRGGQPARRVGLAAHGPADGRGGAGGGGARRTPCCGKGRCYPCRTPRDDRRWRFRRSCRGRPMNAYSGNPFAAPGGFAVGRPVEACIAPPVRRVQLVTIRQLALLTAKERVLWVAIGFAFIAALALLRIAIIGVGDRALITTPFDEALLPPRGEIVDRNGAPLARAFPAYSLWFNPDAMGEGEAALVKPPAQVARELKAIFPDLDEAKVAHQLAAGKGVYLRRRV